MHRFLLSGLKFTGTAALITLGGLTAPAPASDLLELQDGNSVLRSDVLRFNTEEAWFVDTTNTLFTDLYFFNVGDNPAQRELRLEDFDQISLQQPAPNRLLFNGQSSMFGGNLNFSLDSTLIGGAIGSHEARVEDVIEVSFAGDSPLPFTLFSYIDYDLRLDDDPDNDIVTVEGNTILQTDPTGLEATLTAVGRTPSAVEFDEYPFLISRLYDDTRTTLTPTAEPLANVDVTAAFQFDDILQPGETLTFQFVKQIQKQQPPTRVPEPTLLLALGVVVGGLVTLRKR
jgi:hypothetical protein